MSTTHQCYYCLFTSNSAQQTKAINFDAQRCWSFPGMPSSKFPATYGCGTFARKCALKARIWMNFHAVPPQVDRTKTNSSWVRDQPRDAGI